MLESGFSEKFDTNTDFRQSFPSNRYPIKHFFGIIKNLFMLLNLISNFVLKSIHVFYNNNKSNMKNNSNNNNSNNNR